MVLRKPPQLLHELIVITRYIEREAIAVAELKDDMLMLANREIRSRQQGSVAAAIPVADGPEARSGMIPVRPELVAAVRYFRRYAPAGSETACCCRSAEQNLEKPSREHRSRLTPASVLMPTPQKFDDISPVHHESYQGRY